MIEKDKNKNGPGCGFTGLPTPASISQSRSKSKSKNKSSSSAITTKPKKQPKSTSSSSSRQQQPRLFGLDKKATVTPKGNAASSTNAPPKTKNEKQQNIRTIFLQKSVPIASSSSSSPRAAALASTSRHSTSVGPPIGRQILVDDRNKRGRVAAFDGSDDDTQGDEDRRKRNRVHTKLAGKAQLDMVPERDFDGYGELSKAGSSARKSVGTKAELDLAFEGEEEEDEDEDDEDNEEDGDDEMEMERQDGQDAGLEDEEESPPEPDTMDDGSLAGPANAPSPVYDAEIVLAPNSDDLTYSSAEIYAHEGYQPTQQLLDPFDEQEVEEDRECAKLAQLTTNGSGRPDDSGYASHNEADAKDDEDEDAFVPNFIPETLPEESLPPPREKLYIESLVRRPSALLMPPPALIPRPQAPPSTALRPTDYGYRDERGVLQFEIPATQDGADNGERYNPINDEMSLGPVLAEETQGFTLAPLANESESYSTSLADATTQEKGKAKDNGWNTLNDAWSGQVVEKPLPRQTTLSRFFGTGDKKGQSDAEVDTVEEGDGEKEIPQALRLVVQEMMTRASQRATGGEEEVEVREKSMAGDVEEDEIVEEEIYDWGLKDIPTSDAEDNVVSIVSPSPPVSPQKSASNANVLATSSQKLPAPSQSQSSQTGSHRAGPSSLSGPERERRSSTVDETQWESYFTNVSLAPLPPGDDSL